MQTAPIGTDNHVEATKKCPFCAEKILSEAIKCRFCGEFLVQSPKPKAKWYFATHNIVLTLLCVGPLALPLVFMNPRYKTITKCIITVVVIAFTALLCFLLVYVGGLQLTEQIKQLTAN